MKNSRINFLVGLFMVAGILCFGYFAINLSGLPLFGAGHYTLTARFTSISGLKKNAAIEIAGVKVGYVSNIRLKSDKAEVILKVKNKIKIETDTLASIRTKGLIGEKYVKLTPGSDEEMLADNDEIIETEPVLEIEELIGKFMYDQDDKKK